jgi:hypothetical protein
MARTRVGLGFTAALAIVLGGHAVLYGQRAIELQHFIVNCPAACPAVAATVRDMGGQVTQTYENVDAIAVDLPASRLGDVPNIPGAQAVWKDTLIRTPTPDANSVIDIAADDAQVIAEDRLAGYIGTLPADYSFNNVSINADGAQRDGNLGQNVVVAVIDTGTTNSPVVASLRDTVIGGESFVPSTTDPVLSPTSRRNGAHGTWVGTVIAGHAGFLFANTSALVQSLRINAPDSVIACTPALGCPTTASIIPMVGVAPAAKIYALKVFPSTVDSAPSSRIIAAMDRAITLRRNFNAGVPSVPVSGDGSEDNPFVFNSLKIDVVNMSLGGATFFAGRELDESLTLKMLAVGIAPAISAGNEGFGAMTAAGPGDGIGALGVAAANDAKHERVLRDLQLGVGIGALYRPTTHTQTAFFSSRGPTADGRFKPDVIANGFATFAQGTCGTNAACLAGTGSAGISLVSGTSFSGPTAAGALALLRNAFPTAFAINLRNALIETANPAVVGDNSTRIDQGRGYLDVGAALAQLKSGRRSFVLDFSFPDDRVRDNIRDLGFKTVPIVNGQFSTHISNLVPGQVAQFFVNTDVDDKLTVTFSHITPENAPANQNQLFGDDLLVTILDAVTSTNVELLPQTFIVAETTVTATASPGLVRVSIQGDWTNAGRVSADLSITREHVDRGKKTVEGTIAEGQTVTVPFVVPAGAKQLDLELSWKVDWSRYPTNDLDLIVQDPAAKLNVTGATINSPERVSVKNPAAGTWQAMINGFTINADADRDDLWFGLFGWRHVKRDDFELRVTIDGVRMVLPKATPSSGQDH